MSRLSGSIFYANGLFSTVLCWKLAWSWKKNSSHWAKTERAAASLMPPDPYLKKKLLAIAWAVCVCSCGEMRALALGPRPFDHPNHEFRFQAILVLVLLTRPHRTNTINGNSDFLFVVCCAV